MQIASPGRPHLSYCTNIHPGESLAEVRAVVGTHVPRVRELLGASGPFGVGLRLSARAAEDLTAEGALDAFRALLAEHDLYVFTINGFPHGAFHGTAVKEAVYRPDWREKARVLYSDRLAWLLSALLPDGVDGSISTVPGAIRDRGSGANAAAEMAEHLFSHAATLARVKQETGRLVELALEPEPCCFLETTDEAIRFLEDHLFSPAGCARFATLARLSDSDAEALLRRHVGVCVDACHLAVEFESASEALAKLKRAGIRVGKVQVTAALGLSLSGDLRRDEPAFQALERFADGVYLHQVVERRGGRLIRHLDLPDALALGRATPDAGPSEWRVHFHVPVFEEKISPFRSTQPFLVELLGIARGEFVTAHLEVETYTWDVLPPEHRRDDVDTAIARELRFTLEQLGAAGPSRSAE